MTDQIRDRLEAIADIDWNRVEYDTDDVELYDTFAHVGPVFLRYTRNPDLVPEQWSDERKESGRAEQWRDRQQEDAIIDFIRHAADDLRTLLAKLDEQEPRR